MAKPVRKPRAKAPDTRRTQIEKEGLAAHAARVEHDARALARTRKVQVILRVWPEEREALLSAASASGTTFNGFATGLLMNALEQKSLLNVRGVLDAAARTFEPLIRDAHSLKVSGDYRRAVGRLELLLKPLLESVIVGREREAIVDAFETVRRCERVLEVEAAERFRSLKTTGAAS
jgi:hypothetical protein